MRRHAVGAIAVVLASACAHAGHVAGAAPATPAGAAAPTPPDRDYLVFVASEGNDRIALVRYGPGGARVERERKIQRAPTCAAIRRKVTAHGVAKNFVGTGRKRSRPRGV